jgi:hypothetical protein
MSEIKDTITGLAKQLKVAIKIDPKTGTATIEEGAFVKHLPEGLTEDHVKKLGQYTTDVVAAGALAFGELAIDVMKKHKDLPRCELEVPITGKDTIGFTFDRSYETNAAPGSPEKVTKYGRVRAEVNHYAAGNVGEFKKVKNHLAELAMKAMAK